MTPSTFLQPYQLLQPQKLGVSTKTPAHYPPALHTAEISEQIPIRNPPEPPKAGGQEEIKEQVSPAPAAGKALQDPLCDPAPGQPCRRTERP